MMKFYSSGGLGDAWIAFLKIWDKTCCSDDDVWWHHQTGHDVHVDPIEQLMALMPGIVEGKVHKVTKGNMDAVEAQYMDENTLRLRSTAFDIENPIPNLLGVIGKIGSDSDKPIAVIQPAAGRPDKSFRHFTPYAVNTLIDFYRNDGRDVVLLGHKYNAAVPTGVQNLTGKTSVKKALAVMNSASDFIGFDGFLAYAAMSMGVRSRVAFHMPGLSHHYMHPVWRERSEVCLSAQKISDVFCQNWK